jgi:predicted AAA+ superfamily ATPase
MHPLSLPEVSKKNSAIDMEHLLKFGGFPEPFLRGSERTLRRWHNQRTSRIVSDDIRELEQVKELSLIELLINALPERVGSPLSRKNLAQELGVDFKTIEKWLTILESIYYSYRISPFGPPKIRAVKKEQKLYLWDWSEHIDEGKVWENFVGSHLLKYCHFHEDYEGHKMELRFLRDTDGREIDFIVLKNKKALFAVECKTGEKNLSRHISYFAERTDIPKFYQVHRGSKHIVYSDKVALLPFNEFCKVENLI